MELVRSGMCCLFQGKALERRSQAQHNAELTGKAARSCLTRQSAPYSLRYDQVYNAVSVSMPFYVFFLLYNFPTNSWGRALGHPGTWSGERHKVTQSQWSWGRNKRGSAGFQPGELPLSKLALWSLRQ